MYAMPNVVKAAAEARVMNLTQVMKTFIHCGHSPVSSLGAEAGGGEGVLALLGEAFLLLRLFDAIWKVVSVEVVSESESEMGENTWRWVECQNI